MCQDVKKVKTEGEDSFKYNLEKLIKSIEKGEKKLLKIRQYETV